jgi:copper chaperone CopZ
MKQRYLGIGLAALLMVAGSGMANASKPAAAPAVKKSALATATLKVEGMHCQGCAQGVTTKLKGVKGVASAKVDHASKKAVIQYNPAVCKTDSLVKAVKQAGYTAAPVK